MADVSQLILPVRNATTGEVTNQLFDLRGKCDNALSPTSTYPVQNRILYARLNELQVQFPVMPEPTNDLLGKIIQYTGETSASYTKGAWYECVVENSIYRWKEISGTSGDTTQYAVLPTPSVDWLSEIVQYIGPTENGLINGYFYKCVYDSSVPEYKWIEWFVQANGNPNYLVDVYGPTIITELREATITWSDPVDSVIDQQEVATWGGTKVVRKIGSAPTNEFDGELIVNNTVRDQYATDGFVDDTLEYGNTYYYRFFPYSTINTVTKGTTIMVRCQRGVVPIPTQSGNLTFNNTVQTPVLTNTDHFTLSGTTSAKNGGTYTMTATLESDDYRWSDGTATDKTITWVIDKATGVTPSKSSVTIGRHTTTSTIYFDDLYGRSIISAVSSDTDVATVTIGENSITITRGNTLGDVTITITTNSSDNCEAATTTIAVENFPQTVYGFQIDGNESDPDSKVTYLSDCDNYGYTPAHMDFSNDEFDYGSWREDEFFMPKPCMVRFDGTVAYYLDPNDLTKKADGVTPSDIADETFNGNAMNEWGRDGSKIWLKIIPFNDRASAKIYIANYKVDDDYHDYNFHNCDGMSADHFYTAIYNGSLDSNNKLRSLSGKQVKNNTTATQERTYAQNNNVNNKDLWDIGTYGDRVLITFLLYLLIKSTNHQKIGKGICSDGNESNNNSYRTGVHNTKGLLY